MAKLLDEPYTSLVRLHPFVVDNLVDQLVLPVSEPADCLELWGILRTPLGS
jgi:hypothetical protein